MDSLHETVERVLSLSLADACIVVASQSSTANVRWANNTSTTNGSVTSHELFIVSVIDKRVGTVGVTYFPDDRLESLVRQSEAACSGKPEAEDYMPLVEGVGASPDWAATVPATGVEVFGDVATALGKAMEQAESAGTKLFGYAEHTTSTTWLATSAGVRRRHTQPDGRLEINAKTPDLTRSAWTGQATGDFADVDLASLYDRLEERLRWSARSIELPPGRYQVLLEPSAVADMLVYAYWSASARDA
ncbi:MAG TPA: hypothetical protein VHE80_05610, partial [Acidimicrobiales bacterium]|nr:hypothetical protein [Acidimicrobiales bacterium]